MTKEFICMAESPAQTQKVIRQWLSTGYTIEFVAQSSCIDELGKIVVVTSLYRVKAQFSTGKRFYAFETTVGMG